MLSALLRPELAELSAYAPTVPGGIEVRLDANEAPPCPSPAVKEAVRRAIDRVALERYPDARARELKARIAERTGAREGELVVGCGSDEVIALLATAVARPRGRAPQAIVLTPSPTFVMYRVTARAHGLKPVEVALDDAWDLDAGAMARAVEYLSPNVIYVASPNNPTGNRMSDERLVRVLEAAGEDALVVVDEAYVDYAASSAAGARARPSVRAWRERFPALAILRTLSKVGLAALRVGWLEGPEGIVREVDKARQPYNLSATSQAAAAAVLAEAWGEVEAHVAGVVRERERVADAVGKMAGYGVTPSDANFLWVKTPRPSAEVDEALLRRGVVVRSFHASGGRMASQLRITIGTPAENDRLLEGLAACAG